jgi:hypothetical protein
MFKSFAAFTLLVSQTSATPTGQPSGEPTSQPSFDEDTYDWNGGGATVIDSNALTVTDPIGTDKDSIVFDIGSAGADDTTYIGLFSATTFTSHTEGATGGPVTKVACTRAGAGTCTLPLYRGGDVFNPVPAGTYYAMAVNGNDLDYDNSRQTWSSTNEANFQVDISPYISAWGSTLQQILPSPHVERGDDLLITWDGLTAGDIIAFIHDDAAGGTCPSDFYEITTADATVGRGTVALKTSGGYSAGTGFAEIGNYTIHTEVGGADFAGGTCTLTSDRTVTRAVTVIDTDTIQVGSQSSGDEPNVEAGSSLTVNYNLASPSTSGTYVGLFKRLEDPAKHTVDITTGAPVSKAYLPVGVSGAGVIQLTVPITIDTNNVVYTVLMLNDNDAHFEPIATTSYGADCATGPDVTTTVVVHCKTDVTVIPAPTGQPTGEPTGEPSGEPTSNPTSPTGEPTGIPTSSPSYVEEPWGEYVWTEKRHRKAGMCENQCSGHGTCEVNGNCKCFKGLDGEAEWTGPDCSSRTCPFDFAWVGASINSNNLHPWAECSNKGICDRSSGECQCFTGYEGAACQRTVCPDNCNDQGTCWPEKLLASKAGRVYDAPWDAMKHVGCLCDAGYRGPACDQQECPSGADPLSGYGNEAGRDCSGRGICDYSSGICACFTGFFGTRCQHQTTVM